MAKQTQAQKDWYEHHKSDPEWVAKRHAQAKERRARIKGSLIKHITPRYESEISLHKLNDARYRSKKNGLDFNLTPEWYIERIETGVCESVVSFDSAITLPDPRSPTAGIDMKRLPLQILAS